MADATIHLRVPAATKGRWVRASRAAGMRLTDWMTQILDDHMRQQLTTLAIPDGMTFDDLRLARNPDGSIAFEWAVIKRICAANNFPIELFTDGPEDNLGGFIVGWYDAHMRNGGAPDPVAEDLIAEVRAENQSGQPTSFKPGRA